MFAAPVVIVRHPYNIHYTKELNKTKAYSFRIPNYGLFSFKSQTLLLPSIFLKAMQTKSVLKN
jgi:hypothetical protein